MALILPSRIYTLGDYYKWPSIRAYAREVKNGVYLTEREVAGAMALKLPEDAILVPVPSHTGYNETFARLISYYGEWEVRCCLQRDRSLESLYVKKKRGERVSEADTGIWCYGNVPEGRIVLVDNVMATGTTISACIRALGRPCEALCVAVDYATLRNSIKEYREKYTY